MNEKGMIYLLELGIGIALLLTLVTSHSSSTHASNLEAKIRLCHDLAGVWTYNQGSIEDVVARMGIEERVKINSPPRGNGERYSCTATRVGWHSHETITIWIE